MAEADMAAPTGQVVWDCETSGLSREKHDILSISGACGDARFHTYVRPVNPIPPEASRVNKIFDADVADAPLYEEATLAFARWVREVAGPRPLLVAYNGDHFDVPFLLYKNAAIDPARFPRFETIYTADPLRCAQKLLTRDQVKGSYRQASVYGALFGEQPPLEGQHTSQGDVDALRRIVGHDMFREVVSASARRLHDLTGQRMAAARLGPGAPASV
jgi:DNA polymerase III alpha subunit (gram-positive type)